MSVPPLPSIDHFPTLNSQSPKELNHLERSTKKVKNLHHEGALLESVAPMDALETLVSESPSQEIAMENNAGSEITHPEGVLLELATPMETLKTPISEPPQPEIAMEHKAESPKSPSKLNLSKFRNLIHYQRTKLRGDLLCSLIVMMRMRWIAMVLLQ